MFNRDRVNFNLFTANRDYIDFTFKINKNYFIYILFIKFILNSNL